MISEIQHIRLAIISSHPIQYNAPLFRLMSQQAELEVKVFYCWEGTKNQTDPEFGEKITWDIPLLEGYDFTFVPNIAKKPGTHHFSGLDNPEIISQLGEWKADALLVYGWSSKTNLNVLRHFNQQLPIFFRGDSTLQTGGNTFRQIIRKLWLRWVYRHIDFALYPGIRSKEYFLSYGVSLERLFHVPHAIEDDRFSNNEKSREIQALAKRERLNIPKNAIVLLFAGKFVQRKQPVLLLDAVDELSREEPDLNYHLIFVGSGPLENYMLEKAASNERIHIIGFKNQSEMPLIYRLGDIYVLPSSIDTWGLGVNEAMACSRPVLVSDSVGCAEDLVVSGVSGEIFSSEDKANLKKYLKNDWRTEKKL